MVPYWSPMTFIFIHYIITKRYVLQLNSPWIHDFMTSDVVLSSGVLKNVQMMRSYKLENWDGCPRRSKFDVQNPSESPSASGLEKQGVPFRLNSKSKSSIDISSNLEVAIGDISNEVEVQTMSQHLPVRWNTSPFLILQLTIMIRETRRLEDTRSMVAYV